VANEGAAVRDRRCSCKSKWEEKLRKVPRYRPCAVAPSGQGPVISATLIAEIGKITFGEVLGRTKVGLLPSVFRKMEVVRDVDRFRHRGITEEE
jgi:hypothetical protein